jgi:hypothetical protein
VNLVAPSNRRARNENPIWSGLFHFLVNPGCSIDYLQGAAGGYVSAIASAGSEEEFITKAMDALRDRQLSPDDEFDEIEEISAGYWDGTLSDQWLALCKLAFETGEVEFGEFDLYTAV